MDLLFTVVAMSFTGKVVMVTGASSGLGAGTAKRGAKVALVGRNVENLKATETACKAANPNAELLLIAADVTADAERIINSTLEKFGKLDVLINNAGILADGSILDIGVEQFDSILDTNLRAVFLLTKQAAPHLIKTQGNIVNVSSINGLRAFPSASSYSSSKATLYQFTRCIALNLTAKNMCVNAVNPGVVVTNIRIHTRSGLTKEEYANHLRLLRRHTRSDV